MTLPQPPRITAPRLPPLIASDPGENCDGDVLTIQLSALMPSTDEHGFVGAETLAGWTYDFIGAASGSLAVLTIT